MPPKEDSVPGRQAKAAEGSLVRITSEDLMRAAMKIDNGRYRTPEQDKRGSRVVKKIRVLTVDESFSMLL